jgi:hypothetical protein
MERLWLGTWSSGHGFIMLSYASLTGGVPMVNFFAELKRRHIRSGAVVVTKLP